jgi:hypothetical protein
MKQLTLLTGVAAFALMVTSTANAEGGCGIGFHRGPYGGCRANAPVVVVPTAPVVVAQPLPPPAVIVAPPPAVVVQAPAVQSPVTGLICPPGTHPGPYGHRCFTN